MSKESIDSIARHLRLDPNPKFNQGAKMLESYSEMPFEQGFLPMSESTQTVMHHPAGFDYDRVNRLFIREDVITRLTSFENKALTRLFVTPNTYVPTIELTVAMIGMKDASYAGSVRVHIRRIRGKIPVEDEMKHRVLETRPRYGYRINL